jgi:hypothetical protein
MTRFNPADFQDLNKLNKTVIQTRYDAVVSLKNAYKNAACEISNLRCKLLGFKAEVDLLTSTDALDSIKKNEYNQEIYKRLETLKTIEKFTAYPMPYGHEIRYFNGENKKSQVTVTLNYYPKGIYKGGISYHLCNLSAFDIFNDTTIRNISINKLDPINKSHFYSFDITLLNIESTGISNTASIALGSTTSFAVGSDPTSKYSNGSNLFLKDGTNLGVITNITSNSITIGAGITTALSANTILYREGTTLTNGDTSDILERNIDKLSDAYNFFNYNKKTAEDALTRIVQISTQLKVSLILEK